MAKLYTKLSPIVYWMSWTFLFSLQEFPELSNSLTLQQRNSKHLHMHSYVFMNICQHLARKLKESISFDCHWSYFFSSELPISQVHSKVYTLSKLFSIVQSLQTVTFLIYIQYIACPSSLSKYIQKCEKVSMLQNLHVGSINQ